MGLGAPVEGTAPLAGRAPLAEGSLQGRQVCWAAEPSAVLGAAPAAGMQAVDWGPPAAASSQSLRSSVHGKQSLSHVREARSGRIMPAPHVRVCEFANSSAGPNATRRRALTLHAARHHQQRPCQHQQRPQGPWAAGRHSSARHGHCQRTFQFHTARSSVTPPAEPQAVSGADAIYVCYAAQ